MYCTASNEPMSLPESRNFVLFDWFDRYTSEFRFLQCTASLEPRSPPCWDVLKILVAVRRLSKILVWWTARPRCEARLAKLA